MNNWGRRKIIQKAKEIGDNVCFGMSDSGAAEPLICFGSSTQKEVAAIKEGSIQFGMFTKENVIFILAKLETIPWMDTPFHVGHAKGLTHLHDLEQGHGYGCTIIFADSDTGTIKALRYVGLSTEYSKRLKYIIEEQQEAGFNETTYDTKIADIMRNYTSKDMIS